MSEILDTVLSFLSSSISDLIDWVLGFIGDIFTGRSLASLGNSVISIFTNGTFDFSLKSIIETLFGVAFVIFAIKLLVNIIRG